MRKFGVCLALAGVVGAAYYNALGNGFVFDDYRLVVDNPLLQSKSSLIQLFVSPFSLGSRPLRNFSYLLDVRLGGLQPWVFHFSNLFYHWLSACLVFLVALRLTNPSVTSPSQQETEVSRFAWRYRPALFIAALWAVHPVQTDAVTYISGRRDILGGLCLFAGFWAYLRYRATTAPKQVTYGWLLLSCVAYGLGILSKESVIVLPALCWLYDGQREGFAVSLRRHWMFYVIVVLLGAIVLWCFAGAQILLAYERATLFGGTIGAHVATVVRMWWHYLGLFVYPYPLLADYSYDAFPASASLRDSDAIIALAGVAGVTGGLAFLARRFPLCWYGGIWMLVSILPVSHLIPIKEIMAEHYLYVPLFGFCVIVGVMLDALCGTLAVVQAGRVSWRPVVGYVLVTAVLIGAVSWTIIRNRDWENEQTFWSATTLTAPRCVRAHYNLANVYKQQGRRTESAREFSAVLSLVPQHLGAILGFGELAFEAGLYGQALSYVRQAQVLDPQNTKVLYLLAWTQLGLRNLPEAEQIFQQLLTQMPQSVGVYRGLEGVAKERGDAESEARWREKRRAVE